MFTNSTKKKSVLKNFQADVRHTSTYYPHRLNFYTLSPQLEVTLEEFELWAIDRLYSKWTLYLWLVSAADASLQTSPGRD